MEHTSKGYFTMREMIQQEHGRLKRKIGQCQEWSIVQNKVAEVERVFKQEAIESVEVGEEYAVLEDFDDKLLEALHENVLRGQYHYKVPNSEIKSKKKTLKRLANDFPQLLRLINQNSFELLWLKGPKGKHPRIQLIPAK